MADLVADYVLDNGLSAISSLADSIYLCSQDPATFTDATSTYALGHKTWSAGGAFGSPGAGSPNGRQVQSTAITDGTVTGTGTGAKWAVTDAANSRLYANGELSANVALTSGNTFQMAAFTISLPNQ